MKQKHQKRITKVLSFVLALTMVVTTLALSPASVQAAKKKKVVVKKVSITKPVKDTFKLTKGKSYTLKVKVSVKPNKKANKKVVYRTSNKKVASVSSKGTIKAKKVGKAVITVVSKKNSNKKDKLKVEVVPQTKPQVSPAPSISPRVVSTASVAPGIKVTSLEISGDERVKAGESIQLSVNALPDNATDKSVTWGVVPAGYASISQDGKLVAGDVTQRITVYAVANDGSGIMEAKLISIYHNLPQYTDMDVNLNHTAEKSDKIQYNSVWMDMNSINGEYHFAANARDNSVVLDLGSVIDMKYYKEMVVKANTPSAFAIELYPDDLDMSDHNYHNTPRYSGQKMFNYTAFENGTNGETLTESTLLWGNLTKIRYIRIKYIGDTATDENPFEARIESIRLVARDTTGMSDDTVGSIQETFNSSFDYTEDGYAQVTKDSDGFSLFFNNIYYDRERTFLVTASVRASSSEDLNGLISFVSDTSLHGSMNCGPDYEDSEILVERKPKLEDTDWKRISAAVTVPAGKLTPFYLKGTINFDLDNLLLREYDESQEDGLVYFPALPPQYVYTYDCPLVSEQSEGYVVSEGGIVCTPSNETSFTEDEVAAVIPIPKDFDINDYAERMFFDIDYYSDGQLVTEDTQAGLHDISYEIYDDLVVNPAHSAYDQVIGIQAGGCNSNLPSRTQYINFAAGNGGIAIRVAGKTNANIDKVVIKDVRFLHMYPDLNSVVECELVSKEDTAYSVSESGLVFEKEAGTYFGAYTDIVSLAIPSDIDMTEYSKIIIDADYYSDGVKVTEPTGNWTNDLAYQIFEDVTTTPAQYVYQQYNKVQAGGYEEELPETVREADYYAGNGAVLLQVTGKTTTTINKVVVKSVRFE